MKKSILGNTTLEISSVMFGGIINMNESSETAAKYVSYAIEKGVNYFDVAPAASYGDSEKMLGPALVPYRKDINLACKTFCRDAESAKRDLYSSLEVLKTDHFDVYQLHALMGKEDVDAVFAKDGAMNVLIKAKEEGIIRHLGITSHDEDAAVYALAYYDFETVLFPINWALDMGKNFGGRLIDICHYKNIGLLAMKSLAHRKWFDGEGSRFPKSWCKTIYDNDELGVAAMKYALSKGISAMVPPGNFEQFEFVCNHIDECLENPLTSGDLDFLKRELVHVENHQIF